MFAQTRDVYAANLRNNFVQSKAGSLVLSVFNPNLWLSTTSNGEIRPPVDCYPFELAIAELEHERQRTEMYARRALKRVNPATIRFPQAFDRSMKQTYRFEHLRTAGISRLMWAVGTAGGGNSAPGENLTEFLELAAQWSVTELILEQLVAFHSGAAGSIVWVSTLARSHNCRTMFRWASLDICRSLLRHAKLDELPESTIDELVSYITATNTWMPTNISSVPTLSRGLEKLAADCSISLGAYAGTPLDDLFYATRTTAESGLHAAGDADTHPFIRDGGLYIPGSISTFYRTLHLMVLSFLSRTIGQNGASKLFELACADTLKPLAKRDDEFVGADATVAAPNGQGKANSKWQTDFIACKGSALIILGEVKGKLFPPHYRNAKNGYSRDMFQTHKQLGERIEAMAQGAVVSVEGRTFSARFFDEVKSIGVVLHDYGGGVWDADHLDRARGIYMKQPILTVIDLALLGRTLGSINELNDYLLFRQEILSGPHQVALEELDILAAFLEGSDGYLSDIREKQHKGKPHTNIYLRPRYVPETLQRSNHAADDRDEWRHHLANMQKIFFPIDLDQVLAGRE
jgi:hypothetical protein